MTQRYRTKIKKNSMKATRRISVNTEKPNAWIVNPTDRGRKSIKPLNKIYLEDGQEFQIELFNPLQDWLISFRKAR